uniref:CD3 gamma/delta protein n=1 Tax=Siniperca chuatsi TaxID=119488 RepID=E7BLI4_SINCH|nr:CD3 gamma/delta protein [Siniperca chuatsi]
MKCQVVLTACLLLLWTLTASVSCQKGSGLGITVKAVSDGIQVSCSEGYNIASKTGNDKSLVLPYKDESTGEYTCVSADGTDDTSEKPPAIYVKFRTCDNCINLDPPSIAGIVVGNVVATTVIGVAVYLIASQNRSGPTISHKKSSDRQHLVPNEVSNRAPNDHYQPLRHGQKDMYDVLTNRK